MLNTIIREIIILTGNGRGQAIAAVVCFVVVVVVLFFGILATIQAIALMYKNRNNDNWPFILVVLIIQIIGALLYFYGDNFIYILNRHGSDLGCGPGCVENNRIASVICLGCTLIIYHLLPPILKKFAEYANLDNDDHWYTASNIITTIVKVDALFTVVAIMAQTSDFCSDADLGISGAFFIISILVGWGLMIVYGILSYWILDDKSRITWLVPVATVTLALCFPLYILADNEQPLDCGFSCDTFASNVTQNEFTCDVTSNSATRLSFTLVAFIAVGAISILLLFFHDDTKADQIDAPEDTIELAETEKA